MKIHVLAFDVFIWTNQIRVNGESARASFDWLQEGGSALPLTLAKLSKWENRAKTASADKRKTGLYISDYFGNFLPYIHNKSLRHLTVCFFYTYRLVLRGQSVLQFSKLLCSLANHRSQACSTFERILAKTTSQKCKRGKLEVIRMQIIFILCQHEIHLRVTAKCCKSFFLALETLFTPLQIFSCACKFNLRIQSYVHFHKSYHTHANLYDVKIPSY